jgi:D-alanyl-D-alanine carboxypeptidase
VKARPPPAIRDELDRVVRQFRTPGLQYIAVGRDGTRFEYAGGWADIAQRRAMTMQTTLMAYSMSKTITAAAVLQLVEGRIVGLDDPLDRYVPSQPYGPAVTIRQLLAHTSGIPNPLPLRWIHPAAGHGDFREDAALAAVLRRYPRLRSAPGTRFAYSNIGYWLLGSVVAHASGVPFTTWVRDHVLARLGIEAQFLGYEVTSPANHATGYLEKFSLLNLIKGLVIDTGMIGAYSGRWLEIRGHYLNGPAFGGLVGTAGSFATFLRDQLQPQSRLFTDATRGLFYEQQRAGDRPVPMTPGWHIGSRHGTRIFFKEGGGGGFHCMMRLYPDKDLGIVVMSNATAFSVRRLIDASDATFMSS